MPEFEQDGIDFTLVNDGFITVSTETLPGGLVVPVTLTVYSQKFETDLISETTDFIISFTFCPPNFTKVKLADLNFEVSLNEPEKELHFFASNDNRTCTSTSFSASIDGVKIEEEAEG